MIWEQKGWVQQTSSPYICNVKPSVDHIDVEWTDGTAQAHDLCFREKDTNAEWQAIQCPAGETAARIDRLEENTEYEIKLVGLATGEESPVRFARTGYVPGTAVCYVHPEDEIYSPGGQYLGSQTLLRLPGGSLLAGMDTFDHSAEQRTGVICRSDDNGESWCFVSRIYPVFHTALFMHRGVLYLLGTKKECGDLILGCSHDEGKTFSEPVVLLKGTQLDASGPQRGPLPVTEYEGRIYTSLVWGDHKMNEFNPGILSIDADADLMKPENWTITPFTKYDFSWKDAPQGTCPGSIEGNVIVGRDGRLYDLMRVQQSAGAIPATGKHILYRVRTEDPKAPLEFVKFVDSPLACSSKFHVRYDPVTDRYIMLGNETLYPDCRNHQRTVLAMAVSKDLDDWKLVHRIVDYHERSIHEVGVQYPDFLFDGDDIVMLLRVSLNGARNEHDSNYTLFTRFENFRSYIK